MTNSNLDNNSFTSLEENGKSSIFSFITEENGKSENSKDNQESASIENAKQIEEKKSYDNTNNEVKESEKKTESNTVIKEEILKAGDAGSKKTPASEDFTLLFEDNLKDLKEKTVVTGKVILVTKEDVLVDIGAKSEGLISIEEFDGNLPKVGDDIKVFIRKMEAADGGLQLSYRIGKQIYVWQKIEELKSENKPVAGKIIEIVKNGFIVDIGIPVFLHISQLGRHKITKPELYLNKTYEFKITEIDKEKKKISYIPENKKISFDGPPCPNCNSITGKVGTCYLCSNCGTTTGCS